ncbi:MAG: hypothetical protein AB6733_05395 [Clostridiaceae bacterium]
MNIVKSFIEKNKKVIIIFVTSIVVLICSFSIKYLIDKEAEKQTSNQVTSAKVEENILGKEETVVLKEILVKPIENLEDDSIPEDEVTTTKEISISSLKIKDEKNNDKNLIETSKDTLKNSVVYIDGKQYKIELSKDNVLVFANYNFAKDYVLSLEENKVIINKKDKNGNLIADTTYEKRLIREEVRPLFEKYKLQVSSLSEVKDYLSTVTS